MPSNSTASGADILLFAEDPGAANFIAPLPSAVAAHGLSSAVVAAGSAIAVLRQRGVAHSVIDERENDAALLARIAPRLLVVGTASARDTRGLTLIAAARGRLPTIGVVDAAMNAALRFRGRGDDPLSQAPDWVLVPDQWTRTQFLRLGLPEKRVIATGHPHYDVVRAFANARGEAARRALRRRLFPAVPPRAQVWAFVSEGADRPWEEFVLQRVLDALHGSEHRPYVVLRLHPKRLRDHAAYRKKVDMVSREEPALELVYAADVVVGLTSMLLTEAQILGRRVLPLVPRAAERRWLPGVRLGMINAAATSAQIRRRVRSALAGRGLRPTRGADLEKLGIGATVKVASFIEGVLGVSTPAAVR